LASNISRAFACPLEKLTRIGRKFISLEVTHNSYKVKLRSRKDKLKVTEYPQLDFKVMLRKTDRLHPVNVSVTEEAISIEIGFQSKKWVALELASTVLKECVSRMIRKEILQLRCYYLPAARSGILQAHKALIRGVIERIPYVGIEELELDIPRLSGTVSDFLSALITLPKKKGPFYQLTKEFERRLVEGEITVKSLEAYRYPEIKYTFKGNEIPLHMASSAISELAPLFLYLEYVVEPESVLIIEEPEAHLHPAAQRILAELLVRLVREGVYLIITTHSDWLLGQLSNFLLLGKLEASKRQSDKNFLKTDEVSVYLFDYDEESGGYRILPVEITDDGISQEEFLKVHESLYEETIEIQEKLERIEGRLGHSTI